MKEYWEIKRREKKLQKITKEAVLAEHYRKTPQGSNMQRRKCFTQATGLNKSKTVFSTYIPSAKIIFEQETNISLFHKTDYGNFWRCHLTEEEVATILAWEERRGSLVFLRDCLSCSLAMGFNFEENAGNYTKIGFWEHEAKTQKNQMAIRNLAGEAAGTIQSLPFYREADCICAVPSVKEFDLPRDVVSQISAFISKPDITRCFQFEGDKRSVKKANIESKWDIWDNAGLSFRRDIKGNRVILIDDKYQAGITLQYTAMKLQDARASEVYGLCFVKTWGDQDNQRW